jgi:hypothetical protein
MGRKLTLGEWRFGWKADVDAADLQPTVCPMRNVGTLALLAFACGCSRASNDTIKTVAAIEVPLRTTTDHNDLVALMRRLAAANGMHVDDDSEKWGAFQRSLPADEPVDTRATIYVGVWRGSRDDDFEVSVSDMMHLGRAWVTFLQDGRNDLPADKREQALAEIRRRWPDARSVPVLPSGGQPLVEDLRLTPQASLRVLEGFGLRWLPG